MVDRNGMNVNSQLNLHNKSVAADSQLAFVPGPGYYEVGADFDKINKEMSKVKQLRDQGVEQAGIQVVKNSCNFQSKKQRFDDKDLREKALMPGPGSY